MARHVDTSMKALTVHSPMLGGGALHWKGENLADSRRYRGGRSEVITNTSRSINPSAEGFEKCPGEGVPLDALRDE